VKRVFPIIAVLFAVAVVASIACLLTAQWTGRRHAGHAHADAHNWIHTQVALTAEQEKQLIPIEERYEEQRKRFTDTIRSANAELGQALLAERQESPRVQAALAKIQEAQGQLQAATLRHVFEMKPVLKPEQYDKLLNLTANALSQIDHAQ